MLLPRGRGAEFGVVFQVLLDHALGQARQVTDTFHRISLAMSDTNAQEVFDVPFNPAQGVIDTSGDLGLGVVEEKLPDACPELVEGIGR